MSRNTERDSWTFKNPMPTGRGFTSGAVVDEKIFIIGGFPNHNSLTAANEMYDPATNSWTVMSEMPEDHFSLAAAIFHRIAFQLHRRFEVPAHSGMQPDAKNDQN